MFTSSLRCSLSLLGLVLLPLTATSVAGCKGPRKADGDKESAAASTAANAGTSDGSKAAAPTGGPCDQLSTKVCGAAGDKSSTCGSAKTVLALFSDATCNAGLKDFDSVKTKLADLGKNCTTLVEKLCAGVGPQTETCKMVTEKTKEFPPEQCTTMLERIDEIIVDLKKQEQVNQPLTPEQQAVIAAADAPAFGPSDAKVTIVEFSDFQCPYCSRAAEVSQQIKEKYGTKVRFVFRHFPLSFHQEAQVAAEASLAAHTQGKFWEFHDKMFANQQKLDRASLEGYAKDLGLDMGKFKQALDKNEHTAQVKSDLELGNKVTVQGTPTLFVNGKRVNNPTDFAAVAQVIDSALGG